MNKLFAIPVVAAVFIAALLLSGTWTLPGEIGVPERYILEPQFGFYECEFDQHLETYSISLIDRGTFYEGDIYCPANGRNCRLGARVCCDGILCGSTYNYVDLTKRYTSGILGESRSVRVTFSGSGDCANVFYPEGGGSFITGEGLQIYNTKGGFGATIRTYGMLTYDAYRLVQEPHNGGKYVINPVSCTLPLTRVKQVQDQIVPEICVDGCESWGKINRPTGENTLDFGEIWNYLGGYNLAPIEMGVTDPNTGEFVYCEPSGSQGILKSFITFETEAGTTYYVPDTMIRYVGCCPGQTYLGQVCDSSTLEWRQTNEYNCDIFGTISGCPGAGNWVVDPSDPARQRIMRATGCDSNNGCIMTRMTVECTSDTQCPTGESCINWECVDVNPPPWRPTCGNGICEAGENDPLTEHYCPADCNLLPECGDGVCNVGENQGNCPSDCGVALDFNMIWILIFAVLLGAVGYGAGGKTGTVIGAIMGGLIGYAIYWFLSLPWWAQLLFGIFGVAGAGLLTYVLLFGGGAIALLAVYAAWRSGK